MDPGPHLPSLASIPKAELHLHLEGSIQPRTVVDLTGRHGVTMNENDVRMKYAYENFLGFLEAFKWVTSFLREPQDYALITRDLGAHLLTQGVIYAEVTLSIGIMLWRKQSVEANFDAILGAAHELAARGLQMNFVFDAVRQFGTAAAMEVVEAAHRCESKSIVAFGIGGDELSIPTEHFRPIYHRASEIGLRRLMHAGETGGAAKIRESIELLGAERIGHGIAAIHDPALMDLLAERQIPLEVCPQSNIRTGALALQLSRPEAAIEDHPLPQLLRHGIPIALSTDDPAMFHTTLLDEYENVRHMGLSEDEISRLTQMSFTHAFAFTSR
jgi:aminodeoxyfutalosine deaminase